MRSLRVGTTAFISFHLLVLAACGADVAPSTPSTGGKQGAGGLPSAGGTPATPGERGGATASAGGTSSMSGSGGSSASGGASYGGASGGSQAGGVPSGGSSGAGGGSSTSGAGNGNATGGSRASGGSTSSAGGVGSGGQLASGGNGANAGGRTGAGGNSMTGGASTGGASTGGASTGGASTGGASTGGSSSKCSFPAPAGSPVALHGQLKVVGSALQDQASKPVQLKGVSSYWLNWESTRYAESKSALQYMRDNWKLTVFRASMGTEASGGYLTSATNQAALEARIDTIVQNALALGVYVILDWHTEKAVNQQASAVTFFTNLARHYGACPNVLYEDYNEPTGVTWAQIKPYHQAVVSAIRSVDPDNPIILGTPNWSQDVDIASQSPVAGTNLLYTLHFYACSHKAGLRTKGSTALSNGVALFVTEFGATPASGGVAPNNTVCEDETNLWFTWMNQNQVSGVAWKLASGTDSSNLFASGSRPPADGPFPDSVLSQTNGASPGHGQFVTGWLRQ